MEAAAREKGALKLLAVTVLTSFDQQNLAEMGYAGSVEDLVLQRARAALESGCDGVIASGLEAPKIKAAFGDKLLSWSRPASGRPAAPCRRPEARGGRGAGLRQRRRLHRGRAPDPRRR